MKKFKVAANITELTRGNTVMHFHVVDLNGYSQSQMYATQKEAAALANEMNAKLEAVQVVTVDEGEKYAVEYHVMGETVVKAFRIIKQKNERVEMTFRSNRPRKVYRDKKGEYIKLDTQLSKYRHYI
jgi:ribosomal protein L21